MLLVSKNHPDDQEAIEALHRNYVAKFEALNDHLMAFQDQAYAMGRKRGSSDPRPWIDLADIAPANQSIVLCYFADGKQRVCQYILEKTISTETRPFDGDTDYDEETDTYYWPGGWYCFEDGMEVWMNTTSNPTHWMGLPPAPAVKP